MLVVVRWPDLRVALQGMLGYCYRDLSTDPPTLRRVLPWRHPYYAQLWVRNVSSVKGVQLLGTANSTTLVGGGPVIPAAAARVGPEVGRDGFWPADLFGPAPQAGLENFPLNPAASSVSAFSYALLTVHFWRPPYAVLTDQQVYNAPSGLQREWRRFVDRQWRLDTQMLSRESQGFRWVSGLMGSAGVPGSVAMPVAKIHVSRTWYQVPEEAVFLEGDDGTPSGLPNNLLYARTDTYNPITGYFRAGGTTSTNTHGGPRTIAVFLPRAGSDG
jgi:hypothetical protein